MGLVLRRATHGVLVRASGAVAGLLLGAAAARAASPAATALPELGQADFHVSTVGRDSWSGTLAEPRADGGDGPFATVARARDAVRVSRMQDPVPRPYTVLIRGGVHSLHEPLVFTPADSASAGAPTVYAAWPGERPVLSGGTRIVGWAGEAGGSRWAATIPAVRDGLWYATQLFVSGQRRPRARFPNRGFLRSDGPPRFSLETRERLAGRTAGLKVPPPGDPMHKLGMRYKPGDLKRWGNLDDVTLHVLHAWTSAVHWIAELDEAHHTVLYTGPSRFPASRFEWQMPYFVENAYEELDSEGEWYLDRRTGVLTYWPRADEDMTVADATVSTLQTLVRFAGEPENGRFIDGIVFRGLSFQHADWGPLDREWENDGYGGTHFLPAAIHAVGLRHSAFERCEITRCGGYGLYLLDGSAYNRLQQCEIHDLGGGGVLIGSRWSPYDTFPRELPPDDAPEDLLAHRNMVDNCFFHDNGQVFFGVIGGVFIAHSPYNSVTHNRICNLPYSAVTVGRRLDHKYSHAHHNTVAWNHIHHIGSGAMSDLGGIYTEGVSPGTRLHDNRVHDVNHHRYGAWGIYCDQGSAGILIERNLVHTCADGGYMQHIGSANIIRNNIFADNTAGGQISNGRARHPRAGQDLMTVERNIVATRTGEVLAYHWNREDSFRFDRNLYWKPEDRELRFMDWTWDAWRALGQDPHALLADPLFVAAERHDYRLKPGSPAEQIGFEPLDPDRIGLYGDPDWVDTPSRVRPQPFLRIAPPPPDGIDEDFETTPVGERIDGATTVGETDGTAIRVSADTAAGGRHSLKITDGPAPKSHFPYLFYRRTADRGRLRLSFDLRLGRDAVLWHEWRSRGGAYAVGPTLRFGEDDRVTVAGRPVATFPRDEWFRVTISCTLGEGEAPEFSIGILPAAGEPVAVDGLAFGSGGDFAALAWIGWIGLGEKPAALFLDNVSFEVEVQPP